MPRRRTRPAKAYQWGTILNVDKKEVTNPDTCCSSPTDAPLQNQYFAYDVSVKVNCGTYVGHYESPYDYLPSSLAPNQKVEVRPGKHNLYFDLPGDRELKMAIVRRKVERSGPCGTSTASR
jgi:hypothetical protein